MVLLVIAAAASAVINEKRETGEIEKRDGKFFGLFGGWGWGRGWGWGGYGGYGGYPYYGKR